MAPVVHSAPTTVQMPAMSAADKYKSYVRSNSNPNPQYDDNMKEPNNNNPNFKHLNISKNNNSSSINNAQDASPQFFTCYTSYSCTPTDAPSVQSNEKAPESTQKAIMANQGRSRVGSMTSKLESGKPGPNAQFDKVKNAQTPPQPIPQIKLIESSGDSSQMNQTNQFNKLNNVECGKPSPHAQLNNVKNAPSIPSPLVLKNNVTPLGPLSQSAPQRCPPQCPPQSPPQRCPPQCPPQSPPQRCPPKPVGDVKPKGQFGLAHSHSSPTISSKGSSPSQSENLVLHYFQNPHTYKNLQENQLPGQGPVPKSMLPPPAPPAGKSKSTSPRNSFNEKRKSASCDGKSKSGDGKDKDWQNVLTKFYQW